MELLWTSAALVALGGLAIRFGHDSRDATSGHWLREGEKGPKMQNWYALESYAAEAQAERLAAAARERLLREARQAQPARRLLPAFLSMAMALSPAALSRATAYWAGGRLVRFGQGLQRLACTPACGCGEVMEPAL